MNTNSINTSWKLPSISKPASCRGTATKEVEEVEEVEGVEVVEKNLNRLNLNSGISK
jgi:hypothetical protein